MAGERQAVEVEPVGVALPRYLGQNILVIIVPTMIMLVRIILALSQSFLPESTTEFVIVHVFL